MKTSPEIDKVAAAFVKAQAVFRKAVKDSKNPFFKSNYANLDAYIDGSAEGLKENGLAVLQDCTGSEGKVCMSTIILHDSGQWIMSDPIEMKPIDSKPTTYGSTVTYCRRYSMASLLNMGAEDDDGTAGSQSKKTNKQLPQ